MSALEAQLDSSETRTAVESKTPVLPLETIDRAIGSVIRVLFVNQKEFTGKLVGFDDFVNIVLEDVREIKTDGLEGKPVRRMLLNGSQIAMLCP